ncbi:hypothetical protein [Rossellomorea sp. NS-SX7]|uniref:hypothetical protein n=1 Tax=Rossellomorea sp. NS-SX7 TaxID=3463856 RepID=UPI004057D93E
MNWLAHLLKVILISVGRRFLLIFPSGGIIDEIERLIVKSERLLVQTQRFTVKPQRLSTKPQRLLNQTVKLRHFSMKLPSQTWIETTHSTINPVSCE